MASAVILALQSVNEAGFPVFLLSQIKLKACNVIHTIASPPLRLSLRIDWWQTLGSNAFTNFSNQSPISFACEHEKNTCSWFDAILSVQENLQVGEYLFEISDILSSHGSRL